jgi:hypothetical protein
MDTYAGKSMTYVDFEKLCLKAIDAIDTKANPDAPLSYLPDNPKITEPIKIAETKFSDYMGTFSLPWEQIAINRELDYLTLESANWGIYRLLPLSDTKFIIEDMESPLEFEKNDDGKIISLSIKLRSGQVVNASKSIEEGTK